MKKFLIPILVAGVLSSFATTTNVVYIDVNNLQDFEIQMSPETGETNVINFKVYQDRSALDLSGLTPVLYAARDEAISRNVITIEGSSSGNVATITTAGVNLSQGMSELYLRLDFRSGKNPSKYTYPYRVKGKMLILENPITQTGDPVLIGELYFATAAEGDLAVSAIQPGAANLAYASRNGSTPMTGDLDMDGYDIDDAGVVGVDSITFGKTKFYGASTYYEMDGTTTITTKYETNALYLVPNSYQFWKVGDYAVPGLNNLAYKVTSISQCVTPGSPISTLNAGDYFVTCAYTGVAKAEANEIVAYGIVGARFTAVQVFRGFIVDFNFGMGATASGIYPIAKTGVIRPGFAANESVLTTLSATGNARTVVATGTTPTNFADLIVYYSDSAVGDFEISGHLTATYCGKYVSTVTLFPNQ